LIKGNIELLNNGFTETAIKHISKEYIKSLNKPVPSLNIQNQIESKYELLVYTKNFYKKK